MVARIGLVPAHPTGTSLHLGGQVSSLSTLDHLEQFLWCGEVKCVVLRVNAAAIKECCCLMCIQSA